MKRVSLVLCSLFALAPLFSMQQANAMNPWRPKKESLGRSVALPWIRALKVPISVIGAVVCGAIGGLATANLTGSQLLSSTSNGDSGFPSIGGVLYGLGLAYVASALYSAIVHKETPYQQTQDLTERTVETVQNATVKPLKKAIKFPGAILVVGIPAAALMAFVAGQGVITENITIENASKAIQAIVAVFGIAGAMEYLRQLTNFASNKPQ